MSVSEWLSLSLFVMYTCMVSIAGAEEITPTLTSSLTGNPTGGNANITSVCSYGATTSVIDGFQWRYEGFAFPAYQGNGTTCVDYQGNPMSYVYTCDTPNRSFSIFLPNVTENDLLSSTLCCAVSTNQTLSNEKCSTLEDSINSATTQPTTQTTTGNDAVQIKSTALVSLTALLATCALLTEWIPTSDSI